MLYTLRFKKGYSIQTEDHKRALELAALFADDEGFIGLVEPKSCEEENMLDKIHSKLCEIPLPTDDIIDALRPFISGMAETLQECSS